MPKCIKCGNSRYFEGMVLTMKTVKAEFNEYGDMIDVTVEPIDETLLTPLSNGMALEKCSVCGSDRLELDDLYQVLDSNKNCVRDSADEEVKEVIH